MSNEELYNVLKIKDSMIDELIKKLDNKQNIIKEVREYNEEILKENWYGGNEKKYAKHNLEILDKEN